MPFTIGRRLVVLVNSTEESLLKPSAPYCPVTTQLRQEPAQVLTVSAPPAPLRCGSSLMISRPYLRFNGSDIITVFLVNVFVYRDKCLTCAKQAYSYIAHI